MAHRILRLSQRSDKRPCGARATKSRMDQSARAGRWLGGMAGRRFAGRIEAAPLIDSSCTGTFTWFKSSHELQLISYRSSAVLFVWLHDVTVEILMTLE